MISLEYYVFSLRYHDFANRPKCDFWEIGQKCPNFTKSENLQKWSYEAGIWLILTAGTSYTLKNRFGVDSATIPTFRSRFVIFRWFFRKFRLGRQDLENKFSKFPSPKFFFKNYFRQKKCFFHETMILQLHFGIFTSGVLPLDQKPWGSEILSTTFSF